VKKLDKSAVHFKEGIIYDFYKTTTLINSAMKQLATSNRLEFKPFDHLQILAKLEN